MARSVVVGEVVEGTTTPDASTNGMFPVSFTRPGVTPGNWTVDTVTALLEAPPPPPPPTEGAVEGGTVNLEGRAVDVIKTLG